MEGSGSGGGRGVCGEASVLLMGAAYRGKKCVIFLDCVPCIEASSMLFKQSGLVTCMKCFSS